MSTISNGGTTYTPGYFFRELRADVTLQALYGNENINHYETVADRFDFLSTARIFGLESSLGDNSNEGGYFVALTRKNWADLVKQSHQSLNILPENFSNNPAWRQIIGFVDHWYAGNPLCNTLEDRLWLEVDVSGPSPLIPMPSIFFGVKHNTVDESITALEIGLTAFDIKVPSAQRELLTTYFRIIGPLCQGVLVGFMIGRQAAPLRLCTSGANLPDVLNGLKEIGITTLEDHPDWQDFRHFGLHCSHVNIDIGAAFGAKVGIELKFLSAATVRQQQQNQHWPAFMEWLVKKGWCLPQKSQAVLSWPGGHSYHPNLYDFNSPRQHIFRTINHIKLDFQPGRPPRAKAYFMYTIGVS